MQNTLMTFREWALEAVEIYERELAKARAARRALTRPAYPPPDIGPDVPGGGAV